METYVYLAALFASLWAITLFLLVFILLKRKKQKELTSDAKDLLQYILTSGAVVRLEVLDPKNLMYHRG